jgi:hypothetical protein
MIELIVVHQFGGDRVMRRPTARKAESSLLFFSVVRRLEKNILR